MPLATFAQSANLNSVRNPTNRNAEIRCSDPLYDPECTPDTHVPVTRTPDGRIGIEDGPMQDGLPRASDRLDDLERLLDSYQQPHRSFER